MTGWLVREKTYPSYRLAVGRQDGEKLGKFNKVHKWETLMLLTFSLFSSINAITGMQEKTGYQGYFCLW